ncbi:hypothetical protein HOD83_03705 [Candidatus Woesearchaeota archaeon]|jgi:hypothetical protein|nr:hypothetical protein [Candidatus Woesearchaeota archaeon]MBT4114226.1 hypothetical protein [Candidatus Woesearchaeota archaeon]MBT4248658.1 hypothetical protein [Candidatus Woesearchaeota archaeon]
MVGSADNNSVLLGDSDLISLGAVPFEFVRAQSFHDSKEDSARAIEYLTRVKNEYSCPVKLSRGEVPGTILVNVAKSATKTAFQRVAERLTDLVGDAINFQDTIPEDAVLLENATVFPGFFGEPCASRVISDYFGKFNKLIVAHPAAVPEAFPNETDIVWLMVGIYVPKTQLSDQELQFIEDRKQIKDYTDDDLEELESSTDVPFEEVIR